MPIGLNKIILFLRSNSEYTSNKIPQREQTEKQEKSE